jgi:hypothetical protein
VLRHSHISMTPTASMTAACSMQAVATDPPHMRTQENGALDFVPAGITGFQHDEV